MANLNVYRNPDSGSRAVIPFVVDVQNDLLADLPTHIVIPLAHLAAIESMPILRLNPRVEIEGMPLVALTQDMAPVPQRLLKSPVGNLASQRDELLAALDFLFTGY